MVFNLNLLLASPSLVVFSACKTKAWRVGFCPESPVVRCWGWASPHQCCWFGMLLFLLNSMCTYGCHPQRSHRRGVGAPRCLVTHSARYLTHTSLAMLLNPVAHWSCNSDIHFILILILCSKWSQHSQFVDTVCVIVFCTTVRGH